MRVAACDRVRTGRVLALSPAMLSAGGVVVVLCGLLLSACSGPGSDGSAKSSVATSTRSPTAARTTAAATGTLIRVTYSYAFQGEDGDHQTLDVLADGDRRVRQTVTRSEIGAVGEVIVWDGKRGLQYLPGNLHPYTRIDEYTSGYGGIPVIVFPHDSVYFPAKCPHARKTGTAILLGRTGDRWACAGEPETASPFAHEMLIDQPSGVLLSDVATSGYYRRIATAIDFAATAPANAFSTLITK